MIFGKADKNFKVKNIRTFALDRVMNMHRRYRRVFDRYELNYLSVAIELFNKQFDEKDWDCEITYKAYILEGDEKAKELCSEDKKLSVSKDQNLVVTDFGWGNDQYGKFWERGTYIWEVFIDGEEVGSTKFYIEDAGRVTATENPYFEVSSLKTYEDPTGDLEGDERLYLKQFKQESTRYIMSELKITNKVSEEWWCEIFFKYYDDTGILAGVADSKGLITPKLGPGESFPITEGWGSTEEGTWVSDNYRVEVVFMDQVVAVIPFSVGEKDVKRVSDYEALLNEEVSEFYGNTTIKKKPKTSTATDSEGEKETSDDQTDVSIEINDRPLSEILADLDKLIGLKEIKAKVREYVDYVNYLQYREEKGIPDSEDICLHSVFTGNPGTGKTTVAKLLGQIYHSIGLLSKGHVHAVESSDLISGYVRQTGTSTKENIKKARGGILFIDEAYMLFKDGSPNDFGPEAVAALITEMSDGPGDIAIMVAGYPAEMERFINSNPGLKSRFRNYYHFNDYTPDELVDIAHFAADDKDVKLSPEAEKKLKKIITDAFRKRDRTFGNARLVHSMIDEAKMNLGVRVVREYDADQITKDMLMKIESQDIEDLSKGNLQERLKLDVDKALLDQAMEELNSLTGLESIKQEVNELIRLTKYYREMDRDILKAFSMHAIFMGNPGTGKTTVARIIGKIYKALGLLERGHLIDADASDLVAGYVGQTYDKTKKLIKEAMGGVLFIDEAYSITDSSASGSGADFGKKAIAALIKEMEDHRGEFAVIAAGYPHNMSQFLESNPGIKSRFDRTFQFEDFSEDDLWTIAVGMLAKRELKADKKAEAHIKAYITHLYAGRNKFFGNARTMRKMVEKAFRNHELRMAGLKKTERTKAVLSTLKIEDVQEFEPKQAESGRTEIGFKFKD
ncbi:MAG: AAA family ATPase [Bacteroidetes bacterium]|nr:MAG: AAA family ATPase [Bacteroidota bacterium]